MSSAVAEILQSLEELIVLVVWANPEPNDIVFVLDTERAIIITYPYRIDRTVMMHALKFQAAVTGI